MKRKWALLLCVLAAGLAGPGCRKPDRVVETGPATLPERAKQPLAELTPAIDRPADAPDAEKLPERAAGIVVRAEGMIARGDHIQAINLLERAVGFAPASPRIRRDLGLAYAALGDRAKAEPHLSASARTAPNNVRVQLILSQYAIMQRQADKAIIHLRKALLCNDATDDNPDTAEALLRLGNLLERRGCWAASLECYRRLSKLIAAHGRAYSNRGLLSPLVTRPERCMVARGRLLLKLQRPGEAAGLLERAYRRDKTNPQAGRLAVAALIETGEFERSGNIIMEMLAEPLRRGDAIVSAVRWCRAKKDPSAPQSLLGRHLAGGGSDSDFVIAMAEVAAELGGTEKSAEMLAKYLARSPEDKTVAMRLARLYVRTKNFQAAAGQFAAVLASGAADTSRVQKEVALLARHGVSKEFADELAGLRRAQSSRGAASAEAKLKPALLTVAAMLAETGDRRDEAVKFLKQAIEADRKFWPAYEVLEGLYVADGNFEAVDAIARQITRAGGEAWFAFYLTGKSRLDCGKVSEAIESLEQARTRRSGYVPTMLLLGRAYLRAGKFHSAERTLLVAYGLSSGDIAVVKELFNLYMLQRRRSEAGRVVVRFLRNNPKNVPARILMGRFYFATNQTGRARKVLQALLAEAPDNVEVRLLELSFDLPRSLAGEPVPAEQAVPAMKKLRHILTLDAQNIPARRLYAALLANQGKHTAAAGIWAALHRRTPHDARVTSAWLDAMAKAGMNKQAAEAAEEIFRKKPAAPAMRMLALETLVRVKQYAPAEKLVEQWMSEKPDKAVLVMLRYQAMKIYEAVEHYDKAQKLLDRWIASAPERALLSSLRREKLRIFGLAKQYDAAIEYAKKWIRNEPGNAEPRNILIAVLMEAKAYDKAHAVVDEWLAAAGDPGMLKGLKTVKLLLYGRQEQFVELLQFGRKWIAQKPDDAEPYHVLLAVLVTHEKYDQALKVAEDCLVRQKKLAVDPKRTKEIFRAKRAVVEVLLLAKRKPKALARARSFVRSDGENVQALRILRMALASMEKEDEALKVAEKIYKLAPDDPGINNDLGYTWADRGINLDKAEAMIRKALAVKPDEVAFKDSFGWVLYKQGRFAEAKTVFDQVLAAKAGQHPVMLDHAGDVCWRLGLKVEAVRLWGQAVEAAKKEKHPDSETKKVLVTAPRKVKTGRRRGGKPPVAPLGKGVSAKPEDKKE